MEIYLIRHAIAVDSGAPVATSNGERALTEVGVQKMRKQAKALNRLGVEFNVLLTSPLLRTWQTAEIVAEVLSYSDQIVRCEALAPGGEPKKVVAAIKEFESVSSVGVVGHNPDLEELATFLISGRLSAGVVFKKGAVCRIDVSQLEPEPDGELIWHLTPKLLRMLAK